MSDINRDLNLVHPIMRQRAQLVLDDCQKAGLPLRIFEAWRSPNRQRTLFAKGRSTPGPIVTYAKAWQSYHQYGLAADFVGYVDGNWTWDLDDSIWKRLHQVGEQHGLERLGFETPHLQVVGLKISDLMEGNIPEGGDASWSNNLATAISSWDGDPPAPPLHSGGVDRPALAFGGIDWSQTPKASASDWHSKFDGQEWRFDASGVYLRSNPTQPIRSGGAPITCQTIVSVYGPAIHKAAMTYAVPPELIVMTIAAESAADRDVDFTGPKTFRWEPNVEVTDVKPVTFGDYSAGPMQTLATTAREVIVKQGLGYPDKFKTAPYYSSEPQPAPTNNPLYGGDVNIDIGTAEIKSRIAVTGFDPILTAAAYNAGGLYASDKNPWRLRTANDHLNRAAQWYGDACFVLEPMRRPLV